MEEHILYAILTGEWGHVQPLMTVYEELEKRGYIVDVSPMANMRYSTMRIKKDFYIKGYKFDAGYSITDDDIGSKYFRIVDGYEPTIK